MKLVVGLGNPGPKYQNNRHNVGFWVVEQVARSNQAGGWQNRFDGRTTEAWVGGDKVLLLEPQTFMNLSGQAVRKAVDFYKLEVADVLIVADDFSLPLGKLRLRSKGSAGGQNGLKDVIRHLGTDGVHRLRVGVGSPGAADPASFVLSDFSAAERKGIEEAVIDAGRAVEFWCTHGIAAAMNEFNGKESAKE
jgi:PTH1 family peptidyl-tRNA hydrolase